MRETGVYSNYKCACFHLRCCEAVCIQRVIQWMSVWNTMKDVFIIWLPCPCFGAVVFFLDKNCENVKCTLKFKGRPEALRFALYVKFHKIECLLCSARCTEEFALEGWTWVWNILRIKEPPTSPMTTQTAPQALVSRRSRRQSCWLSSKGQLKSEQEKTQKH